MESREDAVILVFALLDELVVSSSDDGDARGAVWLCGHVARIANATRIAMGLDAAARCDRGRG